MTFDEWFNKGYGDFGVDDGLRTLLREAWDAALSLLPETREGLNMKAKAIRHADARRALRIMWESYKVDACADGTIKISPKWKCHRGVLTRMHAANMVREALR